MFDKNGDDLISAGELGTVMRNLGFNPSEEDVRKMISDVDIDGKNPITLFSKYYIHAHIHVSILGIISYI